MLSLGAKRFRRVLAAVGTVAVIGSSIGVAVNAEHDAGVLLKLLSPPGSGYDSSAVALTTANGGAVTVTSATPAMCPDSSGALRSLAANKPCVVDGLALKVRSTVTNNLLQSETLDNASWSKSGTGSVTANTWDFGEGSNTGETVTDSDGAARYAVFQSYTTSTTGAYTFSCYMQAGTLTAGTLRVTVTGGTGTTDCNFSGLTATTVRQTCSITAGAGVTSLTPALFLSTAGGDTGTLKVGGCQLVQASVPGDYCPTTTGAVTCSAETVTVATPAALSRTEGCVCLNITPTWTGANPESFQHTFIHPGALLAYNNSGSANIHAFDGTSSASVAAGFVAGTRKRYCTRWSAAGNFLRIENVTDGTSDTKVFSTFGAFGANTGIGDQNTGTVQANASLDSIVFGRSPTACN
jgi:hypothetical protein